MPHRRDRRPPRDVTVAELLDAVGARASPVIPRDATLREAIVVFEQARHTRVLYVVDDDGFLVGVLTAGGLLRHVETHGHAPQVHARRIPALLGGELVEDVMLHHPVTVAVDDSVADALRKMTDSGAAELPVTDHQGRVVGDLTIIDVLFHALVPDGRTGPA